MVRVFTQIAKRPGTPGHGAFTHAPVLWSVLRPMMESSKKYDRTNSDIVGAVNLWCANRAAAEEKYGHISHWDVSGVTNMARLFESKREFNDDIFIYFFAKFKMIT